MVGARRCYSVPVSAANRAVCRYYFLKAALVDGVSGVVWSLQTVMQSGVCYLTRTTVLEYYCIGHGQRLG